MALRLEGCSLMHPPTCSSVAAREHSAAAVEVGARPVRDALISKQDVKHLNAELSPLLLPHTAGLLMH